MSDRHAALITGSTSGIGLSIARALAHKGHDITLNGFGDAAEIEGIRAALAKDAGVEVRYDSADLSKPAEAARLAIDAETAFGRLDVIVNNAGIQHVSPVEDFPPEKWEAIIAINLSSAFHVVRPAWKGMKERKFGRIIDIASAHGLVASPFKSAYVAAKHGVIGLTKALALEGAEHGIRANAICPGYVLTPLVEKQIPDTMAARGMTREQVIRDVLLYAQPTKEFVEADEIARMCVMLAGDELRSMNGAILSIDGGWVVH
jgi:3-hydroxybutyrate dehydrogenase